MKKYQIDSKIICPRCSGKGKYLSKDCKKCQGSGYINIDSNISDIYIKE